MDDGMLSQEEIDALLKISEEKDKDDHFDEELDVNNYLSTIEADTLGEIGNISIGSSATTLSTLINEKVDITTPAISIIKKQDLISDFPFEHVNIQVNYLEGFVGENMFVMKSDDAAIIADIMLGGKGENPETNLNDIHLSAIQEAMNQMMGSAATSMSTIFNKRVNISPPSIELVAANGEPDLKKDMDDEVFVKVMFQLKVGNLIDSNIMQIIPFPFAHELVAELLNVQSEPQHEEVAATIEQQIEIDEDLVSSQRSIDKHNEQAPQLSYNETQTNTGPQYIGGTMSETNKIQQASFSEFEQVNLDQNEQRNLDMLLDIPLQVTVELGRTKRTVKDILELSSGSIVELDKLAGEPVDILVNQKLIAQGEVVVIDENFGVRVTEVISRADRLMNLK